MKQNLTSEAEFRGEGHLLEEVHAAVGGHGHAKGDRARLAREQLVHNVNGDV